MMRDIVKTSTVICLAAALPACTTMPAYNHIDQDARPLIKEVDSVLIAKQDVVGSDIKVSKISNYIQGHIVPVLIDVGLNAYRSHKSNKLITPIRETLGEYDYNQDIKEEFNQALAQSTLAGAGELKILREEPMGFRAAYIRQSEADAVMFVDVKYAFTPSFDALNLTSSVMVFPVDPALSPYKEKPDDDNIIEFEDNIYRNQFTASMPVETDGKTSENGAFWAEKSEEELTGLMQRAAQKLAAHIADDLSIDELPEITEEEKAAAEAVLAEATDPSEITEAEPVAETPETELDTDA